VVANSKTEIAEGTAWQFDIQLAVAFGDGHGQRMSSAETKDVDDMSIKQVLLQIIADWAAGRMITTSSERIPTATRSPGQTPAHSALMRGMAPVSLKPYTDLRK
jgi:hypothetical protein